MGPSRRAAAPPEWSGEAELLRGGRTRWNSLVGVERDGILMGKWVVFPMLGRPAHLGVVPGLIVLYLLVFLPGSIILPSGVRGICYHYPQQCPSWLVI